jgi:predicted enzyme related to lactoylglutathione lyase
MSERDQYPAGVPCWVDTLQPDPQAAMDFYGPLFGWAFDGPGQMPGDPPGEYFVARVRGRDVAGIGSKPAQGGPPSPMWITHIRVDDADAAVAAAKSAGATVADGPFDALPAGRLAALADPAGALFCVWEASEREGAQLVNEPGAWAMSALMTPDPEGSKAFYRTAFGWEPEPFGEPGSAITLWRRPGYVGGEPHQPVPRDVVAAMFPTDADGPGGALPPQWGVNFWVDDADAVAEHAVALGGSVIVPPHDTPGFRNAVLADPQGASFTVSTLTAGS